MRRIIITFLLLIWPLNIAQAKRIALVIGNDSYSNLPGDYQLQKARNDARATAEAVKGLGFDVTIGLDQNRLDMNLALSKVVNQIEPGDEVMFFFAGHGVRMDGVNYLLPSDIPSIDTADKFLLKSQAIRVERITDLFRNAGARLSILVLDACRNNPYKDNKQRAIGGTRGLAAMDPPEGTLVLFSAGAGQAALDRMSEDDRNPNSVFTRTFLPLLLQDGLELSRLARKVKAQVRDLAKKVGHTQTPAVYNEVIGDVFLSGKKAAVPSTTLAKKADDILWESISKSTKSQDFEFFLKNHPNSRYGSLAKFKLRQLKGTQIALASPDKIPGADILKSKSWIGVFISNNVTDRLKGGPPRGIKVSDVIKGSPSEKAGLLKNDYILEMDSTPVNDVQNFVKSIKARGVGEDVSLKIHRNGVDQPLTLKTGNRLDNFLYLHREAETGEADKILSLARTYSWEKDMPDRMPIAIKWYEKAAQKGSNIAMYELGNLYQYGTSIPKDHNRAAKWYKQAAEKGHIAGMMAIGSAYRYGQGVEKDIAKTIEWYQKAIDKDYAPAMNALAYMMLTSEGVEKDVPSAIGLYKKSAGRGNSYAMYALGDIYRKGRYTKKDIPLALTWHKKSAEKGYTSAMFDLGFMFQQGEGINQDLDRAKQWYEKAAAKNSPAAMYNIGVIYTSDKYKGKNTTKGVEWYTKAANNGHVSAMWYLGYMYEFGQWVKKDPHASHSWYQKAADKGDAFSMYQVGENYDKGQVVGKNSQTAADWIYKSLTKKHKGTIDHFRKYAKQFSKSTRMAIQTKFKENGFYEGKIDGDLGPGTMRALDNLTGS